MYTYMNRRASVTVFAAYNVCVPNAGKMSEYTILE